MVCTRWFHHHHWVPPQAVIKDIKVCSRFSSIKSVTKPMQKRSKAIKLSHLLPGNKTDPPVCWLGIERIRFFGLFVNQTHRKFHQTQVAAWTLVPSDASWPQRSRLATKYCSTLRTNPTCQSFIRSYPKATAEISEKLMDFPLTTDGRKEWKLWRTLLNHAKPLPT